jgi:hypothetical protein
VSFAKIAEARAVKKIVTWIRMWAFESRVLPKEGRQALEVAADEIEAGKWKDVKLPKPKPRKKAAK